VEGQGRMSVITLPPIDGMEFLTEPRRAPLLYLRIRSRKKISTERLLGELHERYGTTKRSLAELKEKGLVAFFPGSSDNGACPRCSTPYAAGSINCLPCQKQRDLADGSWQITKEGMETALELMNRMRG
jgi:hypothetical protein